MSNSDADRARRVILEIVRQSPGDEIVGKAKVFKTFYFAHLFYASRSGGYLTDWPIVKMPNGPGIDGFDELIAGLVKAGAMTTEPAMVGPYRSTCYRATGQPFTSGSLPPQGQDAIRDAVELTADKTGAELTNITHEHSRSWNQAKLGEDLSIYIDLLPEDDGHSAEQMRLEKIKEEVLAVWNE